MGWDTNLDPEKLPKIQERGLEPPVLSMDDYVKFCARMRMKRMSPHPQRRSWDENFPVNAPFRI